MATVSLSTLRTRARRRADMESSSFISNAEANDMINEAYQELYDMLVEAFENYYFKDQNVNLVPGTTNYALATDFYKLISMNYLNGTRYETVFPFNELERNASLVLSNNVPAGSMLIRYVPQPTLLVADGDTIETFNGWESLLITDVAIMMLTKEESATDQLEARREREYKRIEQMAQNRSLLFPGKIGDIAVYDSAYIRDALRYRLYGNTFDLINIQYIGF